MIYQKKYCIWIYNTPPSTQEKQNKTSLHHSTKHFTTKKKHSKPPIVFPIPVLSSGQIGLLLPLFHPLPPLCFHSFLHLSHLRAPSRRIERIQRPSTEAQNQQRLLRIFRESREAAPCYHGGAEGTAALGSFQRPRW